MIVANLSSQGLTSRSLLQAVRGLFGWYVLLYVSVITISGGHG